MPRKHLMPGAAGHSCDRLETTRSQFVTKRLRSVSVCTYNPPNSTSNPGSFLGGNLQHTPSSRVVMIPSKSTRAMRAVAFGLFLVLSSTLFFSSALLGQVSTGTITGTVTDSSGAVIPNATLTITNPATAATRAVTANTQGSY